MKNKEFYNNLSVTIGWSGYPQIVENNDGKILMYKKLDFNFYPECYPNKELNEYPINPYTKEKLEMYNDIIKTNTPKTENKTLIISVVLAVFLLIFLASCSSRKVNKSVIEETAKVTVTDNSKVETKTDSNTKIIDTSTTNEIEFIPIDNSKPIVVNGKSYLNVSIKQRKVKSGISIENNKKVAQIEQKAVKTDIKTNKVVKEKQTERTSFNWWWLLLLIIPIFYYLYRKYFISF